MTMLFTSSYPSPLGPIILASDGTSLTGLWFDGQKHIPKSISQAPTGHQLPVFGQACHWLDLYFAGHIPDFTPPLSPSGTPFQRSVWELLLTIPFGRTTTYGEIAAILARGKGIPTMSAQAVGSAISRNPISIIIPCHRVIGAHGHLTGYAGGVERKEALLRLEGVIM